MSRVRVLIIENDVPTRTALANILGASGWSVDSVNEDKRALEQLKKGPWHLVLANASESSLDSAVFEVLKNLGESAGVPVCVLFLVPAYRGEEVQKRLDKLGLFYTLKPIQLGEFLEYVSELLEKSGAITQPLRRVRELAATGGRRPEPEPTQPGTGMFASRKGYYDFTEEELQEFEDQEKRRKKGEGDKPSE